MFVLVVLVDFEVEESMKQKEEGLERCRVER
jgi:hypothetical protein